MNPSPWTEGHDVLLAGRQLADAAPDLELVAELLTAEGCSVVRTGNRAEVLEFIGSPTPATVILAEPLAALDALGICQHIRSQRLQIPVAVLTSEADEATLVQYLDAGADDVLAFPMGPALLRSRLGALLRWAPCDDKAVVEVGDITINSERHTVTRSEFEVELTLTEFGILELLLHNADIVLSRTTIYERLWGADLHESSKSLDVHVGGLRQKLERHGDRVIHNVRGVGYVVWTDEPHNGSPKASHGATSFS